jgi:putative SOS response-associated peptidase YedK
MAGLYDSFAPVNAAMLACARLQKSGADVRTKCLTILTTAATRQMSAVHDRMPVMLTPEAARLWLSGVSVDELYRSGFFAAPQDGLEIVAV